MGYIGSEEDRTTIIEEVQPITVDVAGGVEEGGVVTIKTENNVEHEVVLQQQHHQQQQQHLGTTEYTSGPDEGGDGVGVLEAGRPEMENGVLVEPASVVEALAMTVATDHEDDPNSTYTLHELGYTTHHIIHDR